MEQKNENEKFLKGLFCGVFLVLICMAGCLLHLQWKMTRRAAVSTDSEKTETLDMNLSQVISCQVIFCRRVLYERYSN